MNELDKYADLKELLSTPEALSIICFNINSNRYQNIHIKRISDVMGIDAKRLEHVSRVFEKLEMAKVHRTGMDVTIEMVENHDDLVQNVIYEVIWENRDAYSVMCKAFLEMQALELAN